jgi:hypothetical protein
LNQDFFIASSICRCLTRQWIGESGLAVSEVSLDGADPQWWMILQVRG